MKNRKTILLLLLAIGVLAVANYVVYFAPGGARSVRRASLVDFHGEVVRISVEQKGAAPTEIERDFGDWRIVAPFAGHADGQAVMRMIDRLTVIPPLDVITDSELLRLSRTRADFALEDPVLRVTVKTDSGETRAFGFGATTPAGDGVYADSDDASAVFVVSTNVFAALDLSADAFRLRTLFLPGMKSVSKFSIKSNDGVILEFARDGQGGWRLRDGAASVQKVVEFLSGLADARADDFIWPVGASNETEHASTALLTGYGLDPDSTVTVSLRDRDEIDRQVSFGKEAGDGRVYALVQNGGAIVTVPASLRDAAAQDPVLFTDSRIFPADARSTEFVSVTEGDALYALARDKGGMWCIESPISAPADQATAESMLSRILSLTSADLCSENGLTVSVSTNGESVSVSRESVLGRHSFEDLRSKEVLRIESTQVKRIVRTPDARSGLAATSVVYDRDRRAWNVENGEDGVTADSDGIVAVLSSICPLLASRVEKLKIPVANLDDYGLDTPYLTVAIDQHAEDSVRRNIIIGKRTRGGRFATVGSSDAVFVLSEDVITKLSTAIVGK